MNSSGKMIGAAAVPASFSGMLLGRCLILLCWVLTSATNGGEAVVVDDLDGRRRSPMAPEMARAAVLLFITHDCPIANAYAPEYRRLWGEYAARGVAFTLVHVDPDATAERLRRHRKEFGLEQLPTVHDREQRLVRAVGAKMTPEAVVVTQVGGVVYRGRVDNLYADYGKRRRQATHRDLRDALDAVLAERSVANPRVPGIGCYIPRLKTP